MIQIEKGEKAALLAVALNSTIFSMKFIAAGLSASVALKAESFHSLSDLIAAVTVFIGLKIAKRKSKAFPYGLYKFENILSIFVSIVILYTAYEIILEVIQEPASQIMNSWLAIVSLVFSILAAFFFSRYENRIARDINSPVLLADSEHIRIDVFSNLVVLVAIVSSVIGFSLDKIAAVAVVLIIGKTGLQIFIDGIRVLLDASIEHETLSRVEKIMLDTPQVVTLKSLTGRNSGRYKFIEAVIVLKTHDFDKAHLIVAQIEKHVCDEIKGIDRVLIQYEPMPKAETVYALPLTDELDAISVHFGEAPRFLLITVKRGEQIAYQARILDNPFSQVEKGKGIMVAELLVQSGADVVIVKTNFSNKGPFYVFAQANVEVVTAEGNTPQEALHFIGVEMPARYDPAGKAELPEEILT